jgi:hypothetical protein
MSVKSDQLIRIQKRQTDAFILVDPSMVELNRSMDSLGGSTPDGAGGRSFIASATKLEAQQCRIVPARSRSTNQVNTLTSGQLIVTKDWTLVARPDFDIQLSDWFTWGNQDYTITFIYSDRRYQIQAQLDLLGQDFRESI